MMKSGILAAALVAVSFNPACGGQSPPTSPARTHADDDIAAHEPRSPRHR